MAIGNNLIDNQLKRVRLLNDAIAWFDAFDTATKSQIIEWIQQDQLSNRGVNKFGDIIGTYSYVTELISKGRKQQGTPYTLFDTGDFYRSMYVAVFRESILIDANPIKGKDNLFEKFGNGIIGLTDENMAKLKERVKKSFIDYARKVLQINRGY